MIVKHGKIKARQENSVFYTEYEYDIYEKTDGNYKEYLLSQSKYTAGEMVNGVDVPIESVAEENYTIHPMATLAEVLAKLAFQTYTWEKELTTI